MILNRQHIITDASRMESPPDGLDRFDFVANEGDINRFIGGGIPYHWHREFEFFRLLSGKLRIGIEEKLFILESGEGCFINSNVMHSFYGIDSEECLYHSLVFDSSIIGGAPGSVFDQRYVKPMIENGPVFIKFSSESNKPFYDYFNRAFSICEIEAKHFEIDLRDIMSHMLLYISSYPSSFSEITRMPQVQSARLRCMMDWINKHIQEPIKAEDIASTANICIREAQRLFLKYIHCTPMQYIRKQRVMACADLLLNSELPLTEIAMRYCFSDASHFSKSFTSIIGIPPSEYRKRNR